MKKLVAPCLSLLLAAAPAAAQAQAPAEAAPAPAAEAPKPAPAPYSLPWMLRTAIPGNSVRLDTVFAFSKPRFTVPVLLFGSYKILPNLAAIVRLGVIHNEAEDPKIGSGTAFVNPAIGVLYGLPLGKSVKTSFFLGTTLPVGTGGGDTPNAAARSANLPSGIFARASMDNALFQINYLTPMVGADIAFVADGFTVQAEVTLLELIRVRGAAVDKDAARTNLTAGLHAGYFPIPQLSIGTELRYQYWIANETIEKGPDPSAIDHWTLGFGPRAHIKLGEKMWLRPGVSLTMALDLPTGFSGKGQEYKIVQVDIPFAF